jgi:hypothetical protein
MSSVTYRYNQGYSFLKKGIKHTIKETLIDGTSGLTISFLEKSGDKFYKFYIKELKKDEYEVKEKKDQTDLPVKTINEKELMKLLKEHKLDIMLNYLNKERGTYKGKVVDLIGGKKPRTKKSTKKSSKKSSKK